MGLVTCFSFAIVHGFVQRHQGNFSMRAGAASRPCTHEYNYDNNLGPALLSMRYTIEAVKDYARVAWGDVTHLEANDLVAKKSSRGASK